jgi:hypothetical protein
MRRFKKKPELGFVVIPGLGRVTGDTVLEGDQYAKFCPSLLVEVLDGTKAPTNALLLDAAPAVSDAEVVAAVKAHEAAHVPAVVQVSASVETPPAAPKPVPAVAKPTPAPVSPSKSSGKKPPAKK